MIGIIFAVMVLSSLAFAIPCGNANALANAVFDGASSAVSLTVTLISVMCLWCGIMNVFEKKGLIKKFSHLISPILRIVFPDAYKKGLCDEISLNISANVLGMGNAATPFGISAMKHLNSLNPTPLRASDDMVMLAVLNTASVDLFPATLIALRQSAGAETVYEIIIPTAVTSFITVVFAVVITKIFSRVF